MQLIKYPAREQWAELLKRPSLDVASLYDQVKITLDEVREHGDTALRNFTLKFDKVDVKVPEVTKEEIAEGVKTVSVELKQAIEMARRNIWKFHS